MNENQSIVSEKQEFKTSHKGEINSIAIINENIIASASFDNTIKLFEK